MNIQNCQLLGQKTLSHLLFNPSHDGILIWKNIHNVKRSHIHKTTKSKCSQILFRSCVFMNVIVKKFLSSSTNPMIWTIASSTTSINSLRWTHNNALEDNFFQSWNNGFRFKGWSIAHYASNIIVLFSKNHCKSKVFWLILNGIQVCVDPSFLRWW
jgi:hypothetical protein